MENKYETPLCIAYRFTERDQIMVSGNPYSTQSDNVSTSGIVIDDGSDGWSF